MKKVTNIYHKLVSDCARVTETNVLPARELYPAKSVEQLAYLQQ